MTNERWNELQTEIAELKDKDKRTSDRVRATYTDPRAPEWFNREVVPAMESLDNKEIEIPCSLEQDIEWANESENIQ